MSETVQSLRDALEQRGHTPEHCAWFRAANSVTIETVMSLMMGFAAIGVGGEGLAALATVKNDPLPELHEVQNAPSHCGSCLW